MTIGMVRKVEGEGETRIAGPTPAEAAVENSC